MLSPARAAHARPAYRPFGARVARTAREGEHMVRVTFTGPELHRFAADGADQRVKLLLPRQDGHLTDVGQDASGASWYERWRATPPAHRSPLRTYTVREVRRAAREVDILMVVHGDGGPATRWAQRARPGDRVVLVGPDARFGSGAGIDWAPGTASELLLAGDETAASAICSILEGLAPDQRAHAFVEVPGTGDALDVRLPAGAALVWLPRDGAHHGERLVPAVRAWAATNIAPGNRAMLPQPLEDVDVDTALLWDSPVHVAAADSCGRGERCGSDFYAWCAGEAAVIKELRRILVSEIGVCRRRVAFMGYWRAGRAETS